MRKVTSLKETFPFCFVNVTALMTLCIMFILHYVHCKHFCIFVLFALMPSIVWPELCNYQ